MIVADNSKKLYEKLEIAQRQLKNVHSKDEKLAIANYICNLYDSIRKVSTDHISPSAKKIYGKTKNKYRFNKMLDEYEYKMKKNYIDTKNIHNSFFESTFKRVSHEFSQVEILGVEETELSEEDFYSIFFEFMNSIGLSKCFDRFVRDERIYSVRYDKHSTLFAYTDTNPLTKDSDIFIEQMEYTLEKMFFLAHEFGHVYDLNNFDDGVAKYNQYFYQSFNGETISKLFERLFVDFLIEKKILLPEAKDLLFILTNNNYDYIVKAYITSLLPDVKIENGSYLGFTPNKIYKLVEKYFSRKDNIRKFINTAGTFEIQDVNSYAYGDVYSMFLKELVKNNNGDLDCLKEFMEYRKDLFSTDIMEKYKITPQSYVKLYKKDIELLKKQSK